MTTLDELLRAHGRLTSIHVERWVQRGLLRPSAEGDSWTFVIDLLDQVYTLRRQLEQLGQAIGRQPAETREAIAVALKNLRER
jgi:chaperone modulatory protein CbpM